MQYSYFNIMMYRVVLVCCTTLQLKTKKITLHLMIMSSN
jgi:hypothetical protein